MKRQKAIRNGFTAVAAISIAASSMGIASAIPFYGFEVKDITSAFNQGNVEMSWTNPTDPDFAKVQIFRNGVKLYEGNGTSFTEVGVEVAASYDYTYITIDKNGLASAGVQDFVSPPILGDTTPPYNTTGVTVSTTTYSVYFDWVNPTDVDFAGTKILRNDKLIATVDNTVEKYEDKNLLSNSTFQYKFIAFDYSNNDATPFIVDGSTDEVPVGSVPEVGMIGTLSSDTTATLLLPPVNDPNFVKYNIYRDDVLYVSTGTTEFVDNNLTPDTTYVYKVAGVYTNGDISRPQTVTIKTKKPLDQVAPADVSDLSTVRTQDTITFNWTNPTDADFERVEITRNGLLLFSGQEEVFADTGLVPGMPYEYRITAIDASGNRSTGLVVIASGDITAPAEVTELAAVATNDGVSLSWKLSADRDTAGYMVYRDSDYLYTVTGATYNDNNVALTGDTHTYTVKAFDEARNVNEGVSVDVATKDLTPVANVTDATYSASASSVTLNWTNPVDEQFDKALVYNSDKLVGTVTGGGSSFTESGLAQLTTQYYRITTVDKAGNESDGTLLEATTTKSSRNNHHSSGGGGGSTAPTTPADGENTSNPADAKPVDSTKTTVDGKTVLTVSDSISGSVKVAVDAESAASGFTVTTKSMNVVVSGNPNVASVVIGSTFKDVAPSNNYKTGSDIVSVTLLDKDGNVVSGTVSIEIPTTLGSELLGNVYEVQADGSLKIVDSKTSPEFGKVIPNAAQGTNYVVATYTKQFEDVANHWSSADVNFLTSKEIVDGYETGDFKPEGTVTRAEFAMMAMKALSYDLGYNVQAPVSDVNKGDWFSGAVSKGFENGIFNGDGSGFNPSKEITKQEMIAILVRIAEKQSGEIKSNGESSKFADSSEISDWAVGTMDKAAEAGIVTGDDAGDLNPQKTGTRGEAATMISRLFKLINIIKK